MAHEWLGSALWRWEQFLSKAALCLIHFYVVLCFSGADAGRAGQGPGRAGPALSGAGGAGASLRLAQGAVSVWPGVRHLPCPHGHPCSPSPLEKRFRNRRAPVYSGSVPPSKINCVCVFSSPSRSAAAGKGAGK